MTYFPTVLLLKFYDILTVDVLLHIETKTCKRWDLLNTKTELQQYCFKPSTIRHRDVRGKYATGAPKSKKIRGRRTRHIEGESSEASWES